MSSVTDVEETRGFIALSCIFFITFLQFPLCLKHLSLSSTSLKQLTLWPSLGDYQFKLQL